MPLSSGSSAKPLAPLYREVPYQDPFEVFRKLHSGPGVLFESLKGPDHISRYSFIGIDPYLTFVVKNGQVEIDCMGKRTISQRKPLQRLRELLAAYPQTAVNGLPPFQGGAAGMLSYDFVRYLEELPDAAIDDLNVPDAHFFLFDRVIAFDHKQEKCWVIVCPGARGTMLGFTETGAGEGASLRDAEKHLSLLADAVAGRVPAYAATRPAGGASDIIAQTSKNEYMRMVTEAKEYIAAGDIFQANLSLRISADIGDTLPVDIYRILREVNPSPFAAFIDFGGYAIVSSSPERLVRVTGRCIDTRPIAGTRPRGRDMAEDEVMSAELLLNEKERAEHIMLIDLERNDLGKVSDYGSVAVDELMITEQYSHVIHIVSNVKGRLAEGKDCFDVIRAAFPGGTITGVPKVRCMEIIEELEGRRRGPYTGSLGYIGYNGNMDLNIIIRTFLVKDRKAYVQAGAGIVADSDPEREYHESLKKAEALLRSLEMLKERGQRPPVST
ncbi:MAG TPA: anthranilate synthase component I family protein [Thermodesulfovibrionales bacterium]|nr:anthranilate synthase component I family protein [Thermodesulfovibrionales bacterium]